MYQEIIVMITGASPVLEVRGAIPLAIFEFKFPLHKAFFLGVLGNMLMVVPILFFVKSFSEFLMHRWYFFNRLMTWLFERFQKKHRGHFDSWQWSSIALFFFVAIPLPLTGSWSGIIASYVLGIPFWKSVAAIFLGIITSGLIVSLLISAGIWGFTFFY